MADDKSNEHEPDPDKTPDESMQRGSEWLDDLIKQYNEDPEFHAELEKQNEETHKKLRESGFSDIGSAISRVSSPFESAIAKITEPVSKLESAFSIFSKFDSEVMEDRTDPVIPAIKGRDAFQHDLLNSIAAAERSKIDRQIRQEETQAQSLETLKAIVMNLEGQRLRAQEALSEQRQENKCQREELDKQRAEAKRKEHINMALIVSALLVSLCAWLFPRSTTQSSQPSVTKSTPPDLQPSKPPIGSPHKKG